MDPITIKHNYHLLSNLEIGQKLWVKPTGELVKDNRWFQGVRRKTDGISRNDIKEPIRITLGEYINNGKITEVEHLIRRLKVVLYGTYPDFDEIQTMLDTFLSKDNVHCTNTCSTNTCSTNTCSTNTYSTNTLPDNSQIFEQPREETPCEPLYEERLLYNKIDDENSENSNEETIPTRQSGIIVKLLGFFCIKY